MKIYSGLKEFKATNPVVTIGMFDGVHSGHRVLLQTTIKKARELNGESVVLTFWPHPRIVLKKNEDSLRFLTSLEEKTILFSNIGIDHLIILPFNKDFSELSALQFVDLVLVNQIKLVHLVIGFNHRFGHDAQDNPINYNEIGIKYNFGVSLIQPVNIGDERSSSTAIRKLLMMGQVIKANQLLGYPYQITGRVVGGQKLGRTINYATANVEIEETAKLVPLDGVYACRVTVLGRQHNGMLNIGYRPTISKQKDYRTIEVHILDFSEEIYSEEITVEFVERIRNEIKFQSVDDLKQQLIIDEKHIREVLC